MDFEQDEVFGKHEVRLFPVVRISSDREAELRAASALLAMIRAASEFGRRVVRLAGGPAGKITCYAEVPFCSEDGGGKEVRPDGIIRAVRGKTDWKALLEVKVGGNPLDQRQFDEYHKLAGAEGFDGLITVSNQPALPNGLPPLSIDRRRLRRVPVVHFSWERLLSEAQLLTRNSSVRDSDQEWMLREWALYVDDQRSKIIQQPDLGKHWHEVLAAARQGSLPAVSLELEDVVRNWDGFLRKTALRLRAKLGVDVEHKCRRSDREDPESRTRRLHQNALKSGELGGTFKIPDAAGDIRVDLLLQARSVRYRLTLKPPTEGRQATRINWLVRQLRNLGGAPQDLSLIVDWDQRGVMSFGRLRELSKDTVTLMKDAHGSRIDRTALPRKYTLEWATALRRGRGQSTVPVLAGIVSDLERFYKLVVEQLVPYTPRAPKLVSSRVESTKEDQQKPPSTTKAHQVPDAVRHAPAIVPTGQGTTEPEALEPGEHDAGADNEVPSGTVDSGTQESGPGTSGTC